MTRAGKQLKTWTTNGGERKRDEKRSKKETHLKVKPTENGFSFFFEHVCVCEVHEDKLTKNLFSKQQLNAIIKKKKIFFFLSFSLSLSTSVFEEKGDLREMKKDPFFLYFSRQEKEESTEQEIDLLFIRYRNSEIFNLLPHWLRYANLFFSFSLLSLMSFSKSDFTHSWRNFQFSSKKGGRPNEQERRKEPDFFPSRLSKVKKNIITLESVETRQLCLVMWPHLM